VLPLALAYTRTRDRIVEPDLKETYLRDMLYTNPEISQYFKDETTHVLDYDMEYDTEIDLVKFPEYKNRIWRIF